MKSPNLRLGFTLIELLTVIAIIAILMGLLLSAVGPAKNAPKKAVAKNDLIQLTTAINQFHADYGVYPVSTTGTNDMEYGGPNANPNAYVVNVLRADSVDAGPNQNNAINTRQTICLDVPMLKDATNPKNGLGTGASGTISGNWYDPWGNTYIVGIDTNYDGYVQGGTLEKYTAGLNYVTTVPSGGNAVQGGCAAGTFGADHVQGSTAAPGDYTHSDDVLSWQ